MVSVKMVILMEQGAGKVGLSPSTAHRLQTTDGMCPQASIGGGQ